MYPYLIFFFIVIAIASLYDVQRDSSRFKYLTITALFVSLAVFAGVRDVSVGIDTPAYHRIFTDIAESVDAFAFRYEPGYILLNLFVSKFTSNSNVLILVASFIFSGLVIRATTKVEIKLTVFFCVFMALSFYFFSFNAIRQALAAAVLMNALPYIVTPNFFKYLLFVFTASLFHFTSLFILPFYWILRCKLNLVVLAFFWLSSLFFLASPTFAKSMLMNLDVVVPETYINYILMDGKDIPGGISSRDILYQLLFLVVISFYNKISFDRLGLVLSNLTIFAICLNNIFIHLGYIERLSVYFQFFIAVYLSYLISRFSPLILRVSLVQLVILLSFSMYLRAVSIGSNGVFPYSSWLP